MSEPSVQSSTRVRLWRGGRLAHDIGLHDLPAHLAEDELAWVDLVAPDERTLDSVIGRFGLAHHAVEDALARHERPKVTRHPGHLFLTVYAASLDHVAPTTHQSRLVVTKVSAFVLPRAIVTLRAGSGFPVEDVVARWEDSADVLARSAPALRPGLLIHGLLDVVVDGHFDTIQRLDDVIEELEDLLFDEVPNARAVQQDTYRLRKELVQLRRVVLPMREVVGGMLRYVSGSELPSGLSPAEASPVGEHLAASGATGAERAPVGRAALVGDFEDLYDHALRAAEWTESLRDMITSAFETNLSLQDARLNTVMKKLASWAAIIAVPTAVTGWFGQNVPYPGFAQPLGLWLSVSLVVGCSFGLYLLFRHRDWL